MSLQLTTGPVTVLGYRTKQKNGEPRTWFGTDIPMDEMQFEVDGEARYRTMVLDKSINGSRPEVGARVQLVVESRPYQQARRGERGDYVATSYLENVVSTVPVKG